MFEKINKEQLTHERIVADFDALYKVRMPKLIRRFIIFGSIATLSLVPSIISSIKSDRYAAMFMTKLTTDWSFALGILNIIFICAFFISAIVKLNVQLAVIKSGEYRISSDGPIKVKKRDRYWLYLVLLFSLPSILFFFLEPAPCTFYFAHFGKYHPAIGPHYSSSEQFATNDIGLTHFTNDMFYVVNYGDKKVISIYNQGLFEYNENNDD